MIISRSRKFIFVHLHKTAGESITAALEPVLGPEDVVCGRRTWLGRSKNDRGCGKLGLEKHSPAVKVREAVGVEEWDRSYVFAFVRNPYYRVLSLYTYVQRLVQQRSLGGVAARQVAKIRGKSGIWGWPLVRALLASENFSEFIRNEDFVKARGARPMWKSLCDGDEQIVEFIGRVENIRADFASVCQKIGVPELPLATHNRSRKKKVNLRDYYATQEDLDLVYDRYQRDFELFEYPSISLSDLGD